METIKKIFADKNFRFNMILHSLILFSFLSIFFFLYITTLTTQAFSSEVTNLMADKMQKVAAQVKTDPVAKQLITHLPLPKMVKMFQQPDKVVTVKNEGLLSIIIFVNVLTWLFLVLCMTIFDSGVDVTFVAIENIITFAFVGAIEFLFFKYIAFKFVPVEPSFITVQFMENLKSVLSQ